MSGLVGPEPPALPPVSGDPGPVEDAGGRLLVAAAVLAGLHGELGGGLAGLEEEAAAWEGEAAAAAVVAASRLRAGAGDLAADVRALAVALLRHAEALAALAATRVALAAQAADLRGTRAALLAEHASLVAAGATSPAALTGLPAWRASAAGLTADLARHREAVERWRAACAAADRALDAAATGAARPAGPLPPGCPRLGPPAPAPPPAHDPAAVAAWWSALPDPARWAVVATSPLVVGRLDGLPPAVRDRANRLALARDLVTLTARERARALTAVERRRLALAGAAAEALRAATRHRDPRTGTAVPALLWDWAPRAHGGDGTAVLALGDPAAARRVAVLVPGLGTEGADLPARARDAWSLWAATRRASADSLATVAWLGYDAPDRWGSGDLDAWRVAGQGLARAGGDELAADLAGLAAARGTDPHLVVVGHSYGAVTVAHGAAGPGLPADDLVLLGAPGAGPARQAGDLGPGPVWVGSASSDPVTLLGDEGRLGGPGTLGRDPAGDDFGARRFAAEHHDRGAGLRWSPDQHRGYLTPGGESLAGLALVVAGRDDEVVRAEPRRDPWWRTPVDPEADRPVRARR